ncbi:hypothetical protein DFJ58DRAFT_718771 [Suillus subalutaceus]|uniref:uncharacterized protein n=1 Tax=Suillus subalutaceus TaxID=48586 RepID=UPI001B8652CA|nr:uncharacterized protein DFJ58DRAFT_718771 [Suillus subalutaceus]KAG1838304.1 hypothetical protein DFJ58DRAFT_718771 [Suillus subalutaceus]
MDERDLFLAELLRHEGHAGHTSDTCPGCPCPTSTPPQYRCQDCFDSQLYCGSCIVQNHIRSPTHCIEEWNGQFFQHVSLKSMGLCIQLGHAIGKWCILPRKVFNNDFSKASAYEFYHSLVRLTDNMGLTRRKDQYESFMCMVREWRHLVMLKRSGHGHDPTGVAGTSEGQCAVLCPACPQPGKNLPDNWQDAPKSKGWLYGLFLVIDANFRLKRHAVSSNKTDPSLSRGWAYFIEETSYKSYILDRAGDVPEKSTCSNHNAVNMAETKLSQGLAAMGMGTVDCAHHNMKHPNGVGDLQKGEKYLNMDYLFFSTLQHLTVDVLNVSYDIACQWHKHLWSRMLSLPPSHHFNYLARTIHFFVPKFHLPAHVSNTKGMGPGCHQDTLDDHFGDWNWKKMKEAQTQKIEHSTAFEEFDSVIISENRMATTFTNPLELKGIAITQASARLSLAQLEAKELERGVDLSLHPDVSPSVLITSGMDLEEEQRCLKVIVDNMGIHATDSQKLSVLRMRMSLCRKIDSWRQTQLLYIPSVRLLITASATGGLNNAELTKLWLPSALNTNTCDPHLQPHDALEELRQCLRVHCSRLNFKREWIQGQGANTHAQNMLARVHARQATCMKCYRTAWGALKSLAASLKKDLSDDDVKPLIDPCATQGEGRRKLTWIWMMDGVDSHADGGDVDGVRVEWCKSRARALRWGEEVDLLQEEMHRANWWEGQGVLQVNKLAPCNAEAGTAAHREAAARMKVCVPMLLGKLTSTIASLPISTAYGHQSCLLKTHWVIRLPHYHYPT